jgi:hypothetical protein
MRYFLTLFINLLFKPYNPFSGDRSFRKTAKPFFSLLPFGKTPGLRLCGDTGFLHIPTSWKLPLLGGGLIYGLPVQKRTGITKRSSEMKNLLKFLGIIALIAVIGFSMAACGDDDGDDGGDKDKDKTSVSSIAWPEGFTYMDGTYAKWGEWENATEGLLLHFYDYDDSSDVIIGNQLFSADLLKIEGKKITVKDGDDEIVFCTDYTLEGTTLTLTGGSGDEWLEKCMDEALAKQTE